MRYVDCTITIRDKTVVFKPPYGKEVPGDLCYSDVAALTIRHLNTLVDQNIECGLDLLKLLGLHLYGILFGSANVREAFEVAYTKFVDEISREDRLRKRRGGVADLRFRLNLFFADQASELTQLPWEFLFMPLASSTALGGYFLTGHSKELILTRRLSDVDQSIDPERDALKILVVCCQPDDLDDIKSQAQSAIAAIKALMDEKASRVVVAEVHEVPTFSNVRKAIETWKPHVLHFIGHGKEGGLAFIRDPNEIDLDDERPGKPPRRKAAWVTSAEIMGLFASRDLRMVFLHACNSASSTWTSTTSLASFRDMARTIVIEAAVPAVIAMQYMIRNGDAKIFVKKFYEQIGAGVEIDEAVRVARYELGQGAAPWNSRRFGTPVVYLHSRDAMILPGPQATTETPPHATMPAAATRPGIAQVAAPDGVRMAGGASAYPAQSRRHLEVPRPQPWTVLTPNREGGIPLDMSTPKPASSASPPPGALLFGSMRSFQREEVVEMLARAYGNAAATDADMAPRRTSWNACARACWRREIRSRSGPCSTTRSDAPRPSTCCRSSRRCATSAPGTSPIV